MEREIYLSFCEELGPGSSSPASE